MRRKNRITIRDVADKAGVSAQTVSRVLNNRPDVSSQTRRNVQQIIAELGYAPNVIARSLSRGRSNTLGVVGFGIELFGPSRVLRGIERKANALGFSLLLKLLDQVEPARVDLVLAELLARQVDGIIWAVPGYVTAFEWLRSRFEELAIPVVILNKRESRDQVVVAIDNRAGGRMATEHLLEQNYRRIGTITGPHEWWEAVERTAGWREALTAAGINALDDLCVEGDWSAASGEVGFHRLISQAPDLEAVFAGNDQMALGLLQAARRVGRRVPEDLAVVGFDDIPEAAYFYPSLTTVRQDPRAVGALAVERMDQLIKAREHDEAFQPEMVWVEPQLVVRQSSVRG